MTTTLHPGSVSTVRDLAHLRGPSPQSPFRWLVRGAIWLLAVSLWVAPANAQAGLDPAKVDAAVAEFARGSRSKQEKTLEAMREAIAKLSDPYLESVRVLATEAKAKTKPRLQVKAKRAKVKDVSEGASFLAELPFPVANQYVFGAGEVARFDAPVRSDAKAKKRSKKRRSKTKSGPRAAPPEVQFRAMLEGYVPDLDLALARVLAKLDSDRSADVFAAFLESWRNGDESFYNALDRTAGTQEGVFFYDVCLDDFVVRCAKTGQRSEVDKSYDDAHDALHSGFLSYRQYRAFREALALSVLLPLDRALPARLSRYEERATSESHSTRDYALMLLGASGRDLSAMAELIAEAAPPLPEPLWGELYNPYPGLRTVFESKMPAMIEDAGSTHAFLEREDAHLRDLRRQISAAAFGVIGPGAKGARGSAR